MGPAARVRLQGSARLRPLLVWPTAAAGRTLQVSVGMRQGGQGGPPRGLRAGGLVGLEPRGVTAQTAGRSLPRAPRPLRETQNAASRPGALTAGGRDVVDALEAREALSRQPSRALALARPAGGVQRGEARGPAHIDLWTCGIAR